MKIMDLYWCIYTLGCIDWIFGIALHCWGLYFTGITMVAINGISYHLGGMNKLE